MLQGTGFVGWLVLVWGGFLVCGVVFLFVLGFFLPDYYQLFVCFQEASSAKGNILLSYIFVFTVIQ